MKRVIGIDIGGTNIRIGTVDREFHLENFIKKSSSFLSADDAVNNLYLEIKEYISKFKLDNEIMAITIGVPSVINKDKTYIYSTPNLKGIEKIDLAKEISKRLGITVFVDRDVNFLLLNDINIKQLDLEKEKTIIGLYIGTGLGNAIYINGKIHSGKNGVAGELGHIPMFGVTDQCTCGNIGCSETICSGRYLKYILDEKIKKSNMDEIFKDYENSDILKKYVENLSIPIATEINILDPDYVILSGGVISIKDFPIDELKKEIIKRTRKPYPANNVQFIMGQNSQEGGVLGGALYAFNKLKI